MTLKSGNLPKTLIKSTYYITNVNILAHFGEKLCGPQTWKWRKIDEKTTF